MFKILFIIISLLMIMKLNQWSENKKWNAVIQATHDSAPVEEAYYFPDSYDSTTIKKF